MVLLRRVIGAVLRKVRLAQGRTLQDVARAAGVSTPYLSELERGRKEPSSEVLAAVCRALGLRLEELLEQALAELTRVRARVTATPPTPSSATRPTVRVSVRPPRTARRGRSRPVTRPSGRPAARRPGPIGWLGSPPR